MCTGQPDDLLVNALLTCKEQKVAYVMKLVYVATYVILIAIMNYVLRTCNHLIL